MNILVFNQDWFVENWRAAGHQVYSCGLFEHLDIVLETAHVHINDILKSIPGKFAPDVIVIHDNSGPNIIAGLEETDIPVLFYSGDTHHHYGIHRYLSHVFDYTLSAQKDYIPYFNEVGSKAEWMPLWADRFIEPSTVKKHDVVFVGNMNPDLNKYRVWFFEELNKLVPVFAMGGKYWEIFPHSEIVINQTVKGDLNFRVFEGMMSGAMLLTEESPNGLTKLFEADKHMVTYSPGNPHHAAEKIRYYLGEKEKAREIGLAGRQEILKKHTAQHRADKLLAVLSGIEKQRSPKKFFSAMARYCTLGLGSEKIDTAVASKSYISAMKCMNMALANHENFDSQLACFTVFACYKYDRFLGGNAGSDMLKKVGEAFPQEPVLKVAALRNYLNQGFYELANELAAKISTESVDVTFKRAEDLIKLILDGKSFSA